MTCLFFKNNFDEIYNDYECFIFNPLEYGKKIKSES